MPFGKKKQQQKITFILEDLFSTVCSQFKKNITPQETCYLGIFQSLK